ncbi:MAG: histidine--tRNA ligase [Lentisphaeria bacterium]|nr:histidine--tRNA ligase [Lentisphaeria bacterium]
MAKNSAPPPGTGDIFPEEIPSWLAIENGAREVFKCFGYGEIRTPVFEYTEVFQRGLGDETEVVKKEMYTFEDRGGRSLTLRPEGTAGVMRALSGTEAMNGVESRVFYIGPMFRGERPSAGRRRQFHQIGVENAGRVAPALDAESITLIARLLDHVGAGGYQILLNTRGVKEDRKPAEDALREHFAPVIDSMCEDCRERLSRNVWRILDCKQPQCQKHIEAAPDAASLFGPASRDYFNEVCDILTDLEIPFKIEPRLVRGLDYYVHTVFELTHPGLGGQSAIAGGGRYELAVPGQNRPIVGVGFAAGVERLLMAREYNKIPVPEPERPQVYLVSLGKEALKYNIRLADTLRSKGIYTMLEAEEKSMKSQMRSADRLKASNVLILGENELANGVCVLKNMADGSQKNIALADVAGEFGK